MDSLVLFRFHSGAAVRITRNTAARLEREGMGYIDSYTAARGGYEVR